MLETVSLRRESHRNKIRKQQRTSLLQKRRLEILSSDQHKHQKKEATYRFLLGEINSSPTFNQNLLQMLMNFSFQQDTEKGYIVLGNYLLDHLLYSSNLAFEFFKDKFSSKRNFAWVVRLLLEAEGVNRAQYIEQIDKFIESSDHEILHYGLNCVSGLLEKGQQSIVVQIPHLKRIIKDLTMEDDKIVRRQANSILLQLLLQSEISRRVLMVEIGIDQEIQRLLCEGQSFKERCLQVILTIFSKSLYHIHSSSVFKQLGFIYQTECIEFKVLVSKIFKEATSNTSLVTLCLLIQTCIKNVICKNFLDFQQNLELVFNNLTTIEVIFDRLKRQGQNDKAYDLKSFFENKFNLFEILLDFEQSQNKQIHQTVSRILSNHYHLTDLQEELLTDIS